MGAASPAAAETSATAGSRPAAQTARQPSNAVRMRRRFIPRRGSILGGMKRLRILTALLGCLAVCAAGLLPAVALVSAAAGEAAPMHTAASGPCDHCPDCG